MNMSPKFWLSQCSLQIGDANIRNIIPRLLEIPNDVYVLLSQIVIGWSSFSPEYCKLIGWYWETIRRQLSIKVTILIHSR